MRRYVIKLFLVAVLLILSCFILYNAAFSGSEVEDNAMRDARMDMLSTRSDVNTDTCTTGMNEASCRSLTAGSINVIITFTNAENNFNLQKKFSVTVESLFYHASRHISLCLISDQQSELIARKLLNEKVSDTSKYSVTALDIKVLKDDYAEMVKPFQQLFSYSPGSYYNHILFFLSIALHKILPQPVDRVIMLDSDLRFRADISQLYAMFDKFSANQMIGLAHEQQPVYMHTFAQYRSKHPGTRVGQPSPTGLAGFNSGVLLLDLYKMRRSSLYNSLLSPESLQQLSTEYGFKGHLGDQDFFTLIGMKYEQLIYTLPCVWNRQLCVWWKQVYPDIFQLYHKCEGEVMIYHGNCNTPIPSD